MSSFQPKIVGMGVLCWLVVMPVFAGLTAQAYHISENTSNAFIGASTTVAGIMMIVFIGITFFVGGFLMTAGIDPDEKLKW